MGFASSSRRRVAFIAEASYGVIPATPAWTVLRLTGGGFTTTPEVLQSQELRSDRNVVDEVVSGLTCRGTVTCELSYGTFDALIAGALWGTWAADSVWNGNTRRWTRAWTCAPSRRSRRPADGIAEWSRPPIRSRCRPS